MADVEVVVGGGTNVVVLGGTTVVTVVGDGAGTVVVTVAGGGAGTVVVLVGAGVCRTGAGAGAIVTLLVGTVVVAGAELLVVAALALLDAPGIPTMLGGLPARPCQLPSLVLTSIGVGSVDAEASIVGPDPPELFTSKPTPISSTPSTLAAMSKGVRFRRKASLVNTMHTYHTYIGPTVRAEAYQISPHTTGAPAFVDVCTAATTPFTTMVQVTRSLGVLALMPTVGLALEVLKLLFQVASDLAVSIFPEAPT